jgi:hypothetical protein
MASMEARFYGHHVGAHNFEEGNVQLDTDIDRKVIQIVAEYACLVRSVLVPKIIELGMIIYSSTFLVNCWFHRMNEYLFVCVIPG